MKRIISIEFTPDGNEPIVRDVGTITRPLADLNPEQIGFSLEEAKQLIRGIQLEVVTNQARYYKLYRRRC